MGKTLADRMVDEFRGDREKQAQLAADPIPTLEKVAKDVTRQIPDTGVYRRIVYFIGSLAILMVVGLIVFYSLGRDMNLEAYFGVLGLLVGALAGALVPTEGGGGNG